MEKRNEVILPLIVLFLLAVKVVLLHKGPAWCGALSIGLPFLQWEGSSVRLLHRRTLSTVVLTPRLPCIYARDLRHGLDMCFREWYAGGCVLPFPGGQLWGWNSFRDFLVVNSAAYAPGPLFLLKPWMRWCEGSECDPRQSLRQHPPGFTPADRLFDWINHRTGTPTGHTMDIGNTVVFIGPYFIRSVPRPAWNLNKELAAGRPAGTLFRRLGQ